MPDMRYMETITVNAAVAHVLDKRLEQPLLGTAPLVLTEDLHEFFVKHTLRNLRSEGSEKAQFVGDGALKSLCRGIFDDPTTLLKNSQEMATRFFNIIRPIVSADGGDLAVVLFQSGSDRYLGILKLDYQTTYSHEVEYVEDSFNVNLISQDIGLPLTHQKLSACAFIKEDTTDDSYDMVLFEKPSGEEGPRYFVNRFLGAERILDRRDKTKVLKKAVEQFARKEFKNDMEKAVQIRDMINEELLGSAYIDLESFAQDMFGTSIDAKEKFTKKLQVCGLDDEKVEVDRLWVQDKMKNKSIKTDTGFTLKGNQEFFNDPARFIMERNGDGSVNYILKNVRNIHS